MQLAFITGTFFVVMSLTCLLFKYTTLTQEVVQAYYQLQKAAFEEEALLLYGVGLFLENARLRSPKTPLCIKDHKVEYTYTFLPHENDTVCMTIKGWKKQVLFSALPTVNHTKTTSCWKVNFC